MSKKPRPTNTFRSPSGRYLDVGVLLAELRRRPGRWMLAYSAAPHATYVALRDGNHRDLRALTTERLEVDFLNEYIDGGQRRGDVFARLVETGGEK